MFYSGEREHSGNGDSPRNPATGTVPRNLLFSREALARAMLSHCDMPEDMDSRQSRKPTTGDSLQTAGTVPMGVHLQNPFKSQIASLLNQ